MEYEEPPVGRGTLRVRHEWFNFTFTFHSCIEYFRNYPVFLPRFGKCTGEFGGLADVNRDCRSDTTEFLNLKEQQQQHMICIVIMFSKTSHRERQIIYVNLNSASEGASNRD